MLAILLSDVLRSSRCRSASLKSHALKEFGPEIVDLLSEIVKECIPLAHRIRFKEIREGIDRQ